MGQYIELLNQIPKVERLFNPPPENAVDNKAMVEQALRERGEHVDDDPLAADRALHKQILG